MLNPFSSEDDLYPRSPRALARRAALWAVICVVSALPSLLWARDGYSRPAMWAGIALFVCLYTAFTSTDAFIRFKNRPLVRRTLYVGYLTRLGVSALFPVGMAVDLLPGMISHGAASGLGFAPRSFEGTLVITIAQGAVLNALLAAFMSVVYAIMRAFAGPVEERRPRGFEVLPASPVLPSLPVQPLAPHVTAAGEGAAPDPPPQVTERG